MFTTLPLMFFVTAAICVALTGLSKSGFAGGLGVMSVPMLSLFVSPQFAAAALLPLLLAMDIWIVWHYRKHWNWRIIALLLPGAAIGLGLGAFGFQWMSAAMVQLAIGVMALFFVLRFLWSGGRAHPDTANPRQPVIAHPKVHAIAVTAMGALSGFASFVAHAGGPPVKGYLLSQNLDKSAFVGTNTVFFFTLNAVKVAAYAAMGQFTAQSLQVSAVLAPMLVVGIVMGTHLHGWIQPKRFSQIVYAVLGIAGVKLIFDSAPQLAGV